jgi:hypothetical protein
MKKYAVHILFLAALKCVVNLMLFKNKQKEKNNKNKG